MAQLRDLIVTGSSSFTGNVQLTTLNIPTASNGSTYGPGSNGNVLTSNGSSVYWGSSGDMGFVAKTGDTMTGSLYVNVTTDTAYNQDTGAIVIGNKAGVNIAIDSDEIMARNNKATSTLYINNDGGTTQFGGSLQPKTDSAIDIGTTSLHWRHGYFDDLFVSTDTGYTATNSAKIGSAVTAGFLDLTNTSPAIRLHRATSGNVSGQITSDTVAGIHITGTAGTDNTTYNSRSIKPLVHINGLTYAAGNIENNGYFMNNTSGVGGGYYTYGNNVEYGRFYISTIGKAGTETTFTNPEDETQTITGYTGNVVGIDQLTLGNNKAVGVNGTNYSNPGTVGNANNAKGLIRIYGQNANYTDIQAQPNGNRTFYLPNFANTMYATHTGSNSAVGNPGLPTYVAANGRLTACAAYATCGTAVSTAAKTANVSGFALATGAAAYVNFTAGANTANNPTLNIAGTGAKEIWHRNTKITNGSNKALLQGTCLFVYDGTRYHLVGNYYDTTYSAATTSAAGLMPALPSSNGTTQYLRGDGTWQNAPVTSVATKTGDVTLGTLTIGNATYNGSTNTTVSIADLGLASTTTFWGITSTAITDGSTTGTVNITIGPTTGNRTATSSDNGVVVMRADNGDEYIWTGNKWNLMGLASSYALASHVHGNITSTGTIASDTAVASGQHLMVTDSNNKVSRSSLTFGTDTSKYLRNDGTWQIVSTADEKVKQTAKTDNVNYKLLFTTSASPTSGNVAEAAYDANITINPSTHEITATTFAGNLTGDVTGDLTGDVTGNLTGNVTGDVTGNLIGNVTGNVTGDLTGNADTASAITQTVKTDNASYNLLISSTSNLTSGEAYGVSYDAGIDINPSTHTLTASNFVGSLTGNVTGNASTADLATLATGANITTTTNGVAYYSDTGGTFANLSSANGALYATSANGALNFGTLPVQQGGTGMTSLTANRIIKGNGTSALIASGVSLDASDNMSGVVAITASGIISTTNTTASTSTTTGAIKSAGGIAAAGQVTATRLAANGSNTSYNLYVNGSSYLNGNSTVKTVIGTSNSTYGDTLPSSASEGQIFFQIADGENTATKISPVAATTSTKYYIIGTQGTGAYTPYVASPNASGTKNTGGIYFQGSTGVLYGAAWNDYAEYRQKSNVNGIPYGKVVIENGDDTVSLSTARLQPCGQIISDTFGFILGPEENSLPIALCGRVLAYPYEDRNSFEVGDAVCTAPDGKISKMTREEIREWPDRILGYVSSIPQYEIWEEKNIVVDGRIWIKVK